MNDNLNYNLSMSKRPQYSLIMKLLKFDVQVIIVAKTVMLTINTIC